MRDKNVTRDFYVNKLGFDEVGGGNYPDYLMVQKDNIGLHFFLFQELEPKENYGQVYIRTNDIQAWYAFARSKSIISNKLQEKPWGQKEFSILDPDNNLLTFGQDAAES